MAKQRKKTHGGRRKGSGRPSDVSRPKTVSFMLTQKDIAFVERYRKAKHLDTRSQALRWLLREARERGE